MKGKIAINSIIKTQYRMDLVNECFDNEIEFSSSDSKIKNLEKLRKFMLDNIEHIQLSDDILKSTISHKAPSTAQRKFADLVKGI